MRVFRDKSGKQLKASEQCLEKPNIFILTLNVIYIKAYWYDTDSVVCMFYKLSP